MQQDKLKLLNVLLAANKPFACALSGNLGAGKTTFVRDFLQLRGFSGYVKSPSFSIVEIYEEIKFLHIDLYRLEIVGKQQLAALGLYDFLDEGYSVFIEWPERLDHKPLKIDFYIRIELEGHSRKYCLH